MFKRDKKWAGEKVILKTRPNFLLGNKKVLLYFILLGGLFYIYTPVMDVLIKLGGIRRGTSIVSLGYIAFIIIGFFILLLIISKIISWSTIKYTITSSRVITEKGLIRRNKSSMPYNTIQDVQIDQGIIGRLIGIGSIMLYSAYDGNNLELNQISEPQEIEELIFEQLNEDRIRNEPISPIHNQYPEENYPNMQNQGYSQYREENPNNQYYNNPNHENQQNYHEPIIMENYPNMQNQGYSQYREENPNNQYYNNPNHENQQNYHEPKNNNIKNNQEFTYSTNTYSINNNGDYNTINEEKKYTNEEFDNSINEALRNLDSDVKFQKQEVEIQEQDEPHNLYEDSIKDSYADNKEEYYHDKKDYGNEEERDNVLERHSSKFNKYKIKK